LSLDEMPTPPLFKLVGEDGEDVFEETAVGDEPSKVGALFAARDLAEEFSAEAAEFGMEVFFGLEPKELEDWGKVEVYAESGEDYVLVVSERGTGLFHADDVARIVAAWTGIPAGRLMEGETAKLLRMEEGLHRRVVLNNHPATIPRTRRYRRGMVSTLWLRISGRSSSTTCSASQFPRKSGIRTSTVQPGCSFRIRRIVSAKIGAPPSFRSSRFTLVTTAWRSPISLTASATRRGSSQSSPSSGRPVITAQKPQLRVQTFPRIMKVAVPALQHSPILGHRALWHTVCS
jgi:hypothetical protein